jgi:hypothetical protein
VSQPPGRVGEQLVAGKRALLLAREESGHEPFMDEPAKFNAAMAELVRPGLA